MFSGKASATTAGRGLPVIDADAIPAELRALDQWVTWRRRNRDGKSTKVPYQSRDPRVGAESNDEDTWSSFAEAMIACADPKNGLDGIGFVFSSEDDYAGVDLDNCIAADGKIEDWARQIFERLPGYAEISPSGKGIKIFVRAGVPGGKGRKIQKLGRDEKGAIECYDRGRYFTVTGNGFAHGHVMIVDAHDELMALHAEWFPPVVKVNERPSQAPRIPSQLDDRGIFDRASRAKNGAKFTQLWAGRLDGYPSKSEADLALCSLLAFYTQDPAAIERMFGQSGLVSAKWAERADYRAATIARALERTTTYDPNHGRQDATSSAKGAEHAADDPAILDATVADLRRTLSEEAWLWPNWIPTGALTLIAAEGGTGKTRFCFDLHRRLANGLPWPDGTPTPTFLEDPKALWVVADNQHREMCDIPEAFGIIDDHVILNAMASDPYDGTSLQTAEELADFEARIKRVKPALVIIDTITNTSDAKAQDSSDAKRQYKPLQEIATRTNVPILCVTHLNAGGKVLGRRAVEKVRVVIQLECPDPENQEHRRKLYVSKSKALKPKALGITMSGEGNEYDGSPPEKPEDGRVEGHTRGPAPAKLRECMDWLAARIGPATLKQYIVLNDAEDAGHNKSTVRRAAEQLGLIETESEELSRQGKPYKLWSMPVDPALF